MNIPPKLSEDLLDAWLNISSKLWNERMTKYLSYNQAIICRLLYAQRVANPEKPYLQVPDTILMSNTHLDRNKQKVCQKELEETANFVKERSLCGLGKSAPLPVLSTMKNFREEYLEHILETQFQ